MLQPLLHLAEVYHLPGFYEPFGAMSHLFGALLFAVLGVALIRRGWGNLARVVSLGIYAFSCVFLMSMSGVYHMMVRGGAASEVMARLDHSAIFVLIAGTFTPTHIILFRGWKRWAPLLFIWSSAITGLTLKVIFFHEVPEWFGLSLYLLLGWFGAISAAFIVQQYGWSIIRPLAIGALAYTLGGLVEFVRWPTIVPGVIEGHEAWHIAVLVGAIYHWRFTVQFAGGAPEPVRRPATQMGNFMSDAGVAISR